MSILSSPIPGSLAERFGYTMLHFLWQGVLIGLIWLCVKWAMQRASARERYIASLAMLGLMAVAPLTTFYLLRSPKINRAGGHSSPPAMSVELPVADKVTADTSGNSLGATKPNAIGIKPGAARGGNGWTWQRVVRACERRIHWLAWGWAVGAGLLSLWHTVGWWRLRQWQRVGVSALAPTLEQIAQLLVQRMHLRHAVRFLQSQQIPVPVALGWFRPVIILPISAVTGLDEMQLRAILTHELAHLRRWDYLVNWAQTLVETLLFFHPAVWWLSREIRTERELCCDDEVLHAGCDRISYVSALGQLAIFQGSHHALAATGGPLLRRMQRLLGSSDASAGPSGLMVLAALALFGGLTFTATRLKAADADPPPKPASTKVSRGRILDRNGVVLAENDTEGKRHYPLGALTGHVTGYLGRTDTKGNFEGRSGLERGLEESLAQGQDVKLTLDSKLQATVEQIMRGGKVERGAAVLLDSRDGSVLAMVSLPNLDANLFIPRINETEFKRLIDDRTQPLLNRATNAAYPPGSNYKLAVGLAAVKHGLSGQQTTCEGSWKIGNRIFHDWKRDGGHGKLDLNAALKNSCNIWFYEAGQAVGIEEVHDAAALLGYGQRTGIEFDEALGCAPDTAHFQKRGDKVSGGDLANISIGQGYALATPLQVAQANATLANGGKLWPNHLVHSIGEREVSHPQRHDLLEAGIKASDLELIRHGMKAAVQEEGGVGHNAAIPGWEVAGQSATSQWRMVKDPQSGQQKMEAVTWFSCFAPYNSPRYALTIVIESGISGGSTNAPLAAEVLLKLQELEAAKK